VALQASYYEISFDVLAWLSDAFEAEEVIENALLVIRTL
jgi:hypothetical protein